MWQQIFAVIGIIALIWVFFWYKKRNPEMFSGQNISKSFTTIGFLALGLIGFVAVLVLITRHVS